MNEQHRMRILLLVNPRAGRVRNQGAVARIERRLRGGDIDVVRVPVSSARRAAGALREALRGESPRRTRVVVAGGDGTIGAALPALMNTPFPLAILPVGSVNVLARELGIPRGLRAAAEVAATGRVWRIDLGLANGRPFALMAGMGFDAAVVGSVAPDVKNVLGSFAYVTRGLRVLATHSPSRFRITADRTTFETDAWLAVVANASRYTYRWRLAPAARIDDGRLDLCLFQSSSAAQTAGQVLAALAGRHAKYPGVLHLQGRSFEFESDPPVKVQLDGDAMGETPVTVSVARRALRIVVPRE
jgi:diacylglycerol kinase (ATP)